jgi:hypothetical protein
MADIDDMPHSKNPGLVHAAKEARRTVTCMESPAACVHRIALTNCKYCHPTGSVEPPPLKIVLLGYEFTRDLCSMAHDTSYSVEIGLLRLSIHLFNPMTAAATGAPIMWVVYPAGSDQHLASKKANSLEDALTTAAALIQDKLDPFMHQTRLCSYSISVR